MHSDLCKRFINLDIELWMYRLIKIVDRKNIYTCKYLFNSFRSIDVLRLLHRFAISKSPYFHDCNKRNRHDTKRDEFG